MSSPINSWAGNIFREFHLIIFCNNSSNSPVTGARQSKGFLSHLSSTQHNTVISDVQGKYISFTRLLCFFTSAAQNESLAGLMKNVEFCSLGERTWGCFPLACFFAHRFQILSSWEGRITLPQTFDCIARFCERLKTIFQLFSLIFRILREPLMEMKR